jgi:hypothetical protein
MLKAGFPPLGIYGLKKTKEEKESQADRTSKREG